MSYEELLNSTAREARVGRPQRVAPSFDAEQIQKGRSTMESTSTVPLPIIPGGQVEEADPFDASLWDVRRAAKYLAKSATWVYREAESGRLPFRRIGRALRFIPSELRAWVQGQPGKSVAVRG
jgi:excisionase family DNA binding protein